MFSRIQDGLIQETGPLAVCEGSARLAESPTFTPGSETLMTYFRPGYDEKLYTQHWNKEDHPRARLLPSPSARVAIYTYSGLANSLPP